MTRIAIRLLFVFIGLLCLSGLGRAAPRFKAIAFDYFVIFDPNSVVPEVEKAFPGKGREFAKAWRAKQFEYCFLRSLTHRYVDFFQVTEDALVYTAEAMELELPEETRKRLTGAYLTLRPWPDSQEALRRLKAAGLRIATVANFSPKMLRANADGAGLTEFFEELLSTDANGSFKPDPHAYELGVQRLKLNKDEILFVAFGGWDAYGAKSFGYTTFWVNRFGLPAEKLGLTPDATSRDMQGLLDFVLGGR